MVKLFLYIKLLSLALSFQASGQQEQLKKKHAQLLRTRQLLSASMIKKHQNLKDIHVQLQKHQLDLHDKLQANAELKKCHESKNSLACQELRLKIIQRDPGLQALQEKIKKLQKSLQRNLNALPRIAALNKQIAQLEAALE